MTRRYLSILLASTMLLTAIPANVAFADETGAAVTVAEETAAVEATEAETLAAELDAAPAEEAAPVEETVSEAATEAQPAEDAAVEDVFVEEPTDDAAETPEEAEPAEDAAELIDGSELIEAVEVVDEAPMPAAAEEETGETGETGETEAEKVQTLEVGVPAEVSMGSNDSKFNKVLTFTTGKSESYAIKISDLVMTGPDNMRLELEVYDVDMESPEYFDITDDCNKRIHLRSESEYRFTFIATDDDENESDKNVAFNIVVEEVAIESVSLTGINTSNAWDALQVGANMSKIAATIIYEDGTSSKVENLSFDDNYSSGDLYLRGEAEYGDVIRIGLEGNSGSSAVVRGAIPNGTYNVTVYDNNYDKIPISTPTTVPTVTVTNNIYDLAANTQIPLNFERYQYFIYRFVAPASGRYTIYTEGSSDTYAYLYDASGKYLEEQDDGAVGLNFALAYDLVGGQTYYYRIQGFDFDSVSGSTMQLIQTVTVTGAVIAANPTKREYTKGTDRYIEEDGLRVNLSYSDGTTQTLGYDDSENSTIRTKDKYGNRITTRFFKGAADTGDSASDYVEELEPGIYFLCVEVETIYGNSEYTKAFHLPIQISVINPGQHNHIWGAWTDSTPATAVAAATQVRKCELCGATETQSVGAPLPAVLNVPANKLTMKKGQSTTKFTVEMAAGDSLVSVTSSNKKALKVTNINPNGTFKLKALKLTGKKKVNLTITLASGATKTVKVTIQSANVKTTKIKVDKKLTLKAKQKVTLKPVIAPVTSQDKVTYKSSNSSVAAVSAKGVVTAKKAGSATITVQSGSKKATCKVTVKKK